MQQVRLPPCISVYFYWFNKQENAVITDTTLLKNAYPLFKQPGLDKITIRYDDIYPLINDLDESFQVEQIGQSFLQRPIYKISTGNGPIRVLMWSQMHGNEPTATAALFDFFNYLARPENTNWRVNWEKKISLQIIPMVNPDGAELHKRHNAQSIDINRDAVALQSLEARLLNQIAEEFKPHFGFNLHDQSRYYTVGDTFNTATISLLAPAFNVAKDINETRLRAMKLTSFIHQQVQAQIPGCVGRYDDKYSYRSFGDSFTAKGISTILVESGHYLNDPHRQIARWLNCMLLIQSMDAIASEHYVEYDREGYEAIPMNRKEGLVDIMLKHVNVNHHFTADFAINYDDEFANAKIEEIGDLRPQSGLETKDMSDYVFVPSKGIMIHEPFTLSRDAYLEYLKQGFSYFIGTATLIDNQSGWPVEVSPCELEQDIPVREGPVHMIFSQDDKPALALIQGVWINLSQHA